MNGRDRLLWAAVFAGPAVWMLSFGTNWVLAGWTCPFHWKPAQYVVSGVALAVSAVSGVVAWGQWQNLGQDVPGEGAGAIPRSRLLAISGVLLSAFSFLLVLAQGIVEAGLGACE